MFKYVSCRPDEYLKVTLREPRTTVTLAPGVHIDAGYFWTSFRDSRKREWHVPTYNIAAIVKKKI